MWHNYVTNTISHTIFVTSLSKHSIHIHHVKSFNRHAKLTAHSVTGHYVLFQSQINVMVLVAKLTPGRKNTWEWLFKSGKFNIGYPQELDGQGHTCVSSVASVECEEIILTKYWLHFCPFNFPFSLNLFFNNLVFFFTVQLYPVPLSTWGHKTGITSTPMLHTDNAQASISLISLSEHSLPYVLPDTRRCIYIRQMKALATVSCNKQVRTWTQYFAVIIKICLRWDK